MKKIFIIVCLLLNASVTTAYAVGESLLFRPEEPIKHIFINNRILATVNDKKISVIDLMKKMDVVFYRQFPQYTSSVPARFQFYQVNWKKILQDLIDKELIIADAEENKLAITNGDVRQEMEMTFGPNIIMNLDKAGLSFNDAWQIMRDEIIIRRMIFLRANAKALRIVTPQDIRAEYEEYIKTNIKPEEWEYNVISIRDSDPAYAAEAANFAHHFLTEDKGSLSDLPPKIQDITPFGKTSKITISETFKHQEKDLSPAYKEVLSTLKADTYTQPIAQKSRDNSSVFRIFYLKKYTAGGPPTFNEVANKLNDKLLEETIDVETTAYLKKLHLHYHVHEGDIKELIADGFEPFVLR